MKVAFSEVSRGQSENESSGTASELSLKLHVLASGSRGNAAVIEDTQSGRALMIDCGICKRDFFNRCAEVGVDPLRIEGILITHEHTDHTKGLGVVSRGLIKEGMRPRLYAASAVRRASTELSALEESCDISAVKTGDSVSVAGMAVQVFPTSHDAVESFGFRVEVAHDAIGYMTDTGYMMDEAFEALQHCRILALESNHDTRMLETGPYPFMLKKRVASDKGHLSNDQATEILEALLSDKLEHVVAMHISENNNTYRLPGETLGAVLERHGHPAHVCSAYQQRIVSAS